MGGTTAKAGLVENGEVLRSEAIEVGGGVMAGSRLLVGAGYMLKLPAIDLAEVGAGGGSICRLDAAGAPKVGPDSAGADPGPVCYGRGGTAPTITDCNLVLGYLDPGGLVGGALKLDRRRRHARRLRATWRARWAARSRRRRPACCGWPSATMMRAIRAVSVERGRDPRQFALLAFGGNGPLFAAGDRRGARDRARDRAADARGVQRLRPAGRRHRASRQPEPAHAAGRMPTRRGSHARAGGAGAGRRAAPGARRISAGAPQRSAAPRSARYVGQSSEIEVPLPDGAGRGAAGGTAGAVRRGARADLRLPRARRRSRWS